MEPVATRPRLILEVNVSKLPKGPPALPTPPEVENEEQAKARQSFLQQNSGVLMIQLCPIVGNVDFLRKVNRADVVFQEDTLQWTWTAEMSDHNSTVTPNGLPYGYLHFLIDQLQTIGYSLVGKPEVLDSPEIEGRVPFQKKIYTFQQPDPSTLNIKSNVVRRI